MTLVFGGVQRLEAVGGGMLKARWNEATGGTVDFYNIYIRNGNSSVFSSTYLWKKVAADKRNVLIRMEADGITFLRNENTYFVGIRAEETGGVEEANTIVKSLSPLGDGSTPLEAPDRKIAKVI